MQDTTRYSHSHPEPALRLNDIGTLLQSHEQEIVNQVVTQLNVHQPPAPPPTPINRHTAAYPPIPVHSLILTSMRITELENQLAELHGAQDLEQAETTGEEPRALGTYNPSYSFSRDMRENGSGIPESLKLLFPGVECSTLVQIIENRFKPTNIYWLLATEKERAESQRTINIGGVEFEQKERDGKESEFKLSGFFKAWAACSGILAKLPPQALQGELATALFIYTMNLYDLLEKYTWDGVKAYHFHFHCKRVTGGNSIYYPNDWRKIDSELIALKCFAHPHITRQPWPMSQNRPASFPRRAYKLPIRESHPVQAFPQASSPPTMSYGPPDCWGNSYSMGYPTTTVALSGNGTGQTTTQVCGNWNYRECRSPYCRHHHICITCASNHKAPQYTLGNTARSHPVRSGPHTRYLLHIFNIIDVPPLFLPFFSLLTLVPYSMYYIKLTSLNNYISY